MAKISELAEYYKEEVIKRVLQGTLIDSSGLKIKEGLFLYFQEQSVDAVKFAVDDKVVTIKLDDNETLDESTSPIDFEYIYWVSKYSQDNSKIEISRLKCPHGKVLLAEQNLCVSNEYIRKLPSNTDITRRIEQLKNNLVFNDGTYIFLIVSSNCKTAEAGIMSDWLLEKSYLTFIPLCAKFSKNSNSHSSGSSESLL